MGFEGKESHVLWLSFLFDRNKIYSVLSLLAENKKRIVRLMAGRHLRNHWDSVKLAGTRRIHIGHDSLVSALLRVITETAGDEQDRLEAG